MKKIRTGSTVILLGLAAAAVFSASAMAGNYTFSVSFSEGDAEFKQINGYDLISVKGCQLAGDQGKPALPVRYIQLCIPAGNEVDGIKITNTRKKVLPGTFNIMPAQPPAPTDGSAVVDFTGPDPQVYSANKYYPDEISVSAHSGNMGGYRIAGFLVYPVQYNPKSGKALFYTNITVSVSYSSKGIPVLPTGRNKAANSEMENTVKGFVYNPESVNTFYPPDKPGLSVTGPAAMGAYETSPEYIIITNGAMEDELRVLADWKTKKGVKAEVYTTAFIYANYSGSDSQEIIRNFISYMHSTYGTQWVLLGGDVNVIPYRGAYGYVQTGPATFETSNDIPADLYYADLDGDWNADEDAIFGELSDNVDLYPDVYVGRAPLSTVGGAVNFANKVIRYEKSPVVSRQNKALFIGSDLNHAPSTLGSTIKDMAGAYFPAGISITKLYEALGNSGAANVISKINDSFNIINHVGHGSVTSVQTILDASWLFNADADAFSNTPGISVLYSISCHSNAFEQNCFSEHWINRIGGGAVAYMGNSHYGWYTPGSAGYGPGEVYDQAFFSALFTYGYTRLGEAFALSKSALIPYSGSIGAYRWSQYALNVLGDPEMPLWTAAPETPTVEHPRLITKGQNLMKVRVTSSGSAVSGALVCVKTETEFYSASTTDANGERVVLTTLDSTGVMDITVSRQNLLPYEGSITIINTFTIDISTPLSGSLVNTSAHTIAGVVSGDTIIETAVVVVNGVEQVVTVNAGAFSDSIVLSEGFNYVYVKIERYTGVILGVSDIISAFYYSFSSGVLLPSGPETNVSSENINIYFPASVVSETVVVVIANNVTDGTITLANNLAQSDLSLKLISELDSTQKECCLFPYDSGVITCTRTISTLNQDATITMYYPSSITDPSLENNIRIYYLDESTGRWTIMPGLQTVNLVSNSVSCQAGHFSVFRLFSYSYKSDDVSAVIAYPNPYSPLKGSGTLKFIQIPTGSVVKIYASGGDLVRELNEDGFGRVIWDGKNSTGEYVANGLYIYVVIPEQGDARRIGKIGVLK